MNIEQIYNVINQENRKDSELETDLFCLKFAVSNNNFQVFLHFLEDNEDFDGALECSIKWASQYENLQILEYVSKNYELSDENLIKGFYSAMCHKQMNSFKYFFENFRHVLLNLEVSKLLAQYSGFEEGISYLFSIEAQEEQAHLNSIIASFDNKKSLKI
jgi:hypothetical protein